LERYREVIVVAESYCKPREILIDPIPQPCFDIFDFPVPFSDPTKKQIIDHDYSQDLKNKPSLKDLPKSLFDSLYNFQKVGIQFGVDRFGRILIGDEMGVGKTVQAISISYLFLKDWPLLIITPSSLRFTWRDELMHWLPFLKEEDIQVFTASYEEFSPLCQIYIISYHIATKLAPVLSKKGFKIAIADEAHYLKSRDVSLVSHFC